MGKSVGSLTKELLAGSRGRPARYLTGDNDPYKRLKAAVKADIDPDAWETLYQTKSRPFKRPESGKTAVKVINHYGDEVLQVYDV